MAENVLETRIQLRYGTYSQWMNSDVILKQGEAAICAFPQNTVIEGLTNNSPDNTPPAIGIKIGDGYHYFPRLPWVQAIAADVYNWAKQQSKPTYTASEIQGLQDFVENAVDVIYSGDIEPKLYRLFKDDSGNYYLQSRSEDNDDWVTDTSNYIDMSVLNKIATWLGSPLDDYWTLQSYLGYRVNEKFNALNYTDTVDQSKVVTSVNQVNGLINVVHSPMYASNLTGTVDVAHGGTGVSSFDAESVLVGNGTEPLKTRLIENVLTDDNNLATNKAIIRYITNATAGLTSAMHYIGEASVVITNGSAVNPQIDGYSFSGAQPGDVITYNQAEFVWTGGNWRLIGDEGSYAIKGSITDVDIADDANISQYKINNLTTDLSNKVDKVDGKILTSNDFTDEYKTKLNNIEEEAQKNVIEHIYINGTEAVPTVVEGKPNSLSLRVSALSEEEEDKIYSIEYGAQVNKIEHIFLNEVELPITTVKELDKSIHIKINEFTDEEKQKLEGIESGAQVNNIERISINGTQYTPVDKEVSITIDQAALNLNVLEGAQIPTISGMDKEEIEQVQKKLQLARIAATGDVKDLKQTIDTYIILDCGDSTTVI